MPVRLFGQERDSNVQVFCNCKDTCMVCLGHVDCGGCCFGICVAPKTLVEGIKVKKGTFREVKVLRAFKSKSGRKWLIITPDGSYELIPKPKKKKKKEFDLSQIWK